MRGKTLLKVFEAFAGYGSQRMALRNLGIEHEVVAISEFDKYADASYQAIHGETWNMGDITKIDVNDVPEHDLFTYSFPCQDISVAGKGKGFSKDSGTRSGLLWESERIIKAKKPKYLLMENVKNLISKKFMPGFAEWILVLEELGYSNYYEVLNAKDFGIPQNRERVFMVSILGEHEPYVFPKPIQLEKRLKDVLEDEVDERYYLDDERAQQFIATMTDSNEIGYVPYKKDGKQHQSNTVYDKEKVAPTIEARDYKGAKQTLEPERILGIFDKENSTHQSGSVYNKDKIAPTLDTMQGGWRQPSIIEPSFAVGSAQKNASVTDGSYSPTLTSSMGTGGGHVPMFDEQYRIRKLTPLECWRLMDVTDEDFYKAQAVSSNSQLYKQAGNSIVVAVLEAIFRNMFLEVPDEDLIGEHISLF